MNSCSLNIFTTEVSVYNMIYNLLNSLNICNIYSLDVMMNKLNAHQFWNKKLNEIFWVYIYAIYAFNQRECVHKNVKIWNHKITFILILQISPMFIFSWTNLIKLMFAVVFYYACVSFLHINISNNWKSLMSCFNVTKNLEWEDCEFKF